MKKDFKKLSLDYANKSTEEFLEFTLNYFKEYVTFSNSLGAEDTVLTDMIAIINPNTVIFTIDTGRLPQETYDCIEVVKKKYGIIIKTYFPLNKDIEKMVNKYGHNHFYKSTDNRKMCCYFRKVRPLERALTNYKAWICGLRKEQAVTRQDLEMVEWDDIHNIYKINPLINWSTNEIWDYIKKNNIPYNTLHDKGFPSIGCLPCTRAIKHGEDIRSGRWWWEEKDKKECGIHIKNGKVYRIGEENERT